VLDFASENLEIMNVVNLATAAHRVEIELDADEERSRSAGDGDEASRGGGRRAISRVV